MFKWRSPVEINSHVRRSDLATARKSTVMFTVSDLCPIGLSVELSSALLALSPLFPPSGRLFAELSSSFLAFSPFLSDDDQEHDDITKVWRLLSLSAALLSALLALSFSPLSSFWSSVSRAIVFFSRFLPFSLRRQQGARRHH